MTYRFHLIKIVALMLLFVVITVMLAIGADTETTTETSKLSTFFDNTWTSIALIISEAAAFLPSKFSGIVKTVVSLFSSLFSKKS